MKYLSVIYEIHDFIWGIPLIALIIIVGVWLTCILKGIQVTKLPKAFKCLVQKEEGKGEVSTFQALCISLSATIGTGNITGVAAAIAIGGPGALFWMVITAIFGMATKYTEGFLAIKYRRIEKGRIIGGPHAYIEFGMGHKFKWLAKLFAILGMLAAILGIGTLTQINGITDSAKDVFDKDSLHVLHIFGNEISLVSIIVGGIITLVSALVLIGGVKRIGRVCEYLIPIMASVYVMICLTLIFTNVKEVPSAFASILKMAFTGRAAIGGVCAITIRNAIQQGVAKGIFTNEAGLGSAPIALATAKTDDPVKQGLISMTSTFLGTLIICTMTGICIVLTGAWDLGLQGINITNYAFSVGLPFSDLVCSILLFICITCFAFTTIIGWNVYGVRCLDYLTGGNPVIEKIYQWLYIIAILFGAFLKVDVIWTLAEIFNGLMAIPNLIALLALSKVVAKDTNQYFKKGKTVKIK